MDFDAVSTLIKIVEAAEQELMEPKLLSSLEPLLETIELLSYKLHFLQAFLVECKTKMNDGDTRARRLYADVQDEVARIYEKYDYWGGNAAVKPCKDIHHHLKRIVRDIEEVKDRILEEKRRAALEAEEQNITIWDTYQNALKTENEVIVGFDSDIEKIVNRLCYSFFMGSVFTILKNSNIAKFRKYVLKLQVMPLVGEGGIGKTTLAKRVYRHPITIASFQIRAWVVVSKVHNLKEMLIGLLSCISPITSEIYNIDEAQIAEKLSTSLMRQKYLIFLDDIWTTTAWDAIQGYLPENFNGSRILVTTRCKEVAKYLSTNPYQVKYQTFPDRWELFSRKVFGLSQCVVPKKYVPIGERIVLGCGGLPLVVVLISGFLATVKGSLEIWRDVAETLDGVGTYDNNKRISKIVSLSYKYLPSHLKACFQYFGVFPEDSDIPVKKLINLWVAEGFIKPHNNMSSEEVGEIYLHDLINRSLVQIDELSIEGKVKSCNIHDRVHEVCVRASIKGNALCIISDNHAPKACRWLSFQTSHWSITQASYGNCTADKIHSVLCFSKDVYHSKCRLVYPCLKLLRVLDLSLVKWSQGIPRKISDLVHLRYLALSTIGSLYKLRFFKLKNLRTLIVTSWIENCPLQLPCDLLGLRQLRHLHVDKRCSQYLPCLVKKNLQTLYWLKVASSDEKPNFRMVPNLRELGIFIEGQLAPSYLGSLVYLHLLEKLKFEVGRVERFYLPTRFPPNLNKLTLRYTYLPWKEMDTIGKLPHLKVLKLKDFACCGSKWEPSKQGFRELKALLISRSNLKYWNASSNNFPVLERLILRYCWELKQVPLKFAKIGTLKLIVLECCYFSLVSSAEQISSANKLLFKGMTDCPLRVRKVGIKVELPNNESSDEESVESSKEKCVGNSKEECVGSSKVKLPNNESFENERDESSKEENDESSEEECVGRSKVISLICGLFTDVDNSLVSTTQGTHSIYGSDTNAKTRGVTHMKKAILQYATSGKHVVEFDGLNPVGSSGTAFKSYIALLGRVKVPITIESWHKVPSEIKTLIWQDILSTYDIPNTIEMKRHWIKYVGERWKDFKTKLVNKYIYEALLHKSPCDKYSYLDQETWNEFVQRHTDLEYEAIKKKHQNIQAKNVHPHVLVRGGYQRLEKIMMEEKMKEQQELAYSDPLYTFTPPIPPRRSRKWKRIRIDKSENFHTEATRLITEKIDSLELQASQGELVEFRKQDILSVALSTNRHHGRVRAMGRGYGIKSVFSYAKHHQMPIEDVKQIVDSAVAEALEKQSQQFEVRIAEMMKQFSCMHTPINQAAQSKQKDDVCVDVEPQSLSEKASSPDPFVDLPALGARCQLYLEDPIRRPVAYGTAYTGGQVHGVVLNANQMKVSVDKVIDPSANVPFPTSEVQVLGDAFQHFIIWSKKLIELCTQFDELKGKTKLTFQSVVQSHHHEFTLADPDSLTTVCKKAYRITSSLEYNLVIHMARGIMGNIEYDLQLERVEIMRFLNMETIDISLFQFFIRGIYKDYGLETKNTYGFLDPHWIQPKMMTRDERIMYINTTMQYGKKNCYLAPYILNGHWMLMAICPLLHEIYWFDSIGLEPREDIKEIMEACVNATNTLSGWKQNCPPKWTTCSCALQRGTTECGYYVMKFMLEIVSNQAYKEMNKSLGRQERFSYNQQEIDEVRDTWSKLLIDEWVNKMLL